MSKFIDQIRNIQKEELALQAAIEKIKKTLSRKRTEKSKAPYLKHLATAEENHLSFKKGMKAKYNRIENKILDYLGINKINESNEKRALKEAEETHKKLQNLQKERIARFTKNIKVLTSELQYLTDLNNPQPKEPVEE